MSSYKNFVISGHPRSGTQFLSQLMNLSPTWRVEHEVDYNHDELDRTPEHQKVIQSRLERDNYGEVSSCLKWCLEGLDVAKKGIILRHPEEVWTSNINGHVGILKMMDLAGGQVSPAYMQTLIRDIDQHWIRFYEETIILDNAIDNGIPTIDFVLMVSDPEYTQKLVRNYDIDDLEVTKELITKQVNETEFEKKVFNNFEEVPARLKQGFHEKLWWFIKKHW